MWGFFLPAAFGLSRFLRFSCQLQATLNRQDEKPRVIEPVEFVKLIAKIGKRGFHGPG